MNNKRGWRKGIGLPEMIAMIIVVIPTTIFMITLLFDYWALMRVDNQLKLIAHRTITALNNAEDLSSKDSAIDSMKPEEYEMIQSLCPPIKPNIAFDRIGDMPFGQTKVEVMMTYDNLNHLDPKQMSSSITSYSYHDSNGSFTLECKGN